MPLDVSEKKIDEFLRSNQGWVIEGCYTDLPELVIPKSTEIVFMNLPVEICISNAKNRPWEPHKYESKEAQDANLKMLIDWISQYAERCDTFSYASHRELYEKYTRKKRMHVTNEKDR